MPGPGVSAGKVSSCDWRLVTGDKTGGGELSVSDNTHGDISEKTLVYVTRTREKENDYVCLHPMMI